MAQKAWFVRAGKRAKEFKRFQQEGLIGIGFGLKTDLTNVTDPSDIEVAYRESNPSQDHMRTITQHIDEIFLFLVEMQSGDHVLMPSRDSTRLLLGTVEEGPALFDPARAEDGDYPHYRRVRWGLWMQDVPKGKLVDAELFYYPYTIKEISGGLGSLGL